MIKQLTSFLDYDVFAEAALVIFALVFIAVCIRTFLSNSELMREHAAIVVNDKNGDQ